MNQKPYRDILDAAAADSISPEPNLWPRISAQLERKSMMMTLRTRPFVAVLIALLILLALSGVVYALGRSLGYLPGLGIVNQNSPFYVLAEPVSQTRKGVTVTVEKAILNAGNILLAYKVEGLTPDNFSFLEPLNTCMSVEELRFPGGESVKPSSGVSSNTIDSGFESTNKYGPVPAGATDATLFIPCINGSLSPGILPENWELPLHFVPAPPDVALTIMPVIELTSPSALPGMTVIPAIESTLSPVPHAGAANPLTLTRIIDAGDSYRLIFGEDYRHSYILFGELNPPVSSQSSEWRIERVNLSLIDNNGQAITWQLPSDIDQPVSDSLRKDVWAIVVPGFAPPLHITETARYTFPSNSRETYTFEFAAGPNPQPLQEWKLNKVFQLAGHTVRLTRISANPVRTGYVFSFETDDARVNSLSARIDGYPSVDHLLLSFPRFGGWDFYEYYSAELPKGKLKVILSDLYINGETKDWTLVWQPENGVTENLPTTLTPDKSDETIPPWVGTPAIGNPPHSEKPLPEGIKNGDIVLGPDNLFYFIWENTKSRIWFPGTIGDDEIQSLPDGSVTNFRLVGATQPNTSAGYLVITDKGNVYWLDPVSGRKYSLETVSLPYDELNSIPTAYGEQYFPTYTQY